MPTSVFLTLSLAVVEPAASRHRFLWIPMSEPVFWIVLAGVVVGLGILVATLVRARRKNRQRGRD